MQRDYLYNCHSIRHYQNLYCRVRLLKINAQLTVPRQEFFSMVKTLALKTMQRLVIKVAFQLTESTLSRALCYGRQGLGLSHAPKATAYPK